jgi:hypothetical protein
MNNNNTEIQQLHNQYRQIKQSYDIIKHVNNPNTEKFLNKMNQIQNRIDELRGGKGKRRTKKNIRRRIKRNLTKNKKMKGSGFFGKSSKNKVAKQYFKEEYMKDIKPRKIKGRSIHYGNKFDSIDPLRYN